MQRLGRTSPIIQVKLALTMTSSSGMAFAELADSASARVPIVSGRRTAPYSAASSAAHPVSVKGARSPDASASSPPRAGPTKPPSSEAACTAQYSSASCLTLPAPYMGTHFCAQCRLAALLSMIMVWQLRKLTIAGSIAGNSGHCWQALLSAHLVGAHGAGAVAGGADVGQVQLRARHLQRGAEARHPAPRQQLRKAARHPAPDHACIHDARLVQLHDLCTSHATHGASASTASSALLSKWPQDACGSA